MNKYIDAEKLIHEIERRKKIEGWCSVGRDTADVYYARGFRFACDFVLNTIDSLQKEQPKSRFIQVKCINPYDDSWEKDKIYTCEVWHHGDLNHDFWDVYYDYGKDPKYVQFPTIELLHDEFEVLKQEQPDVNLV